MADTEANENLGSFFRENTKLFREYAEARVELLRLKLLRAAARSAGTFLWIIISLFLVFLVIIFAGLVLGFWLSSLTGSYISGFGITTGILLLLLLLLAVFRRALFINPFIRLFIQRSAGEDEEEQ